MRFPPLVGSRQVEERGSRAESHIAPRLPTFSPAWPQIVQPFLSSLPQEPQVVRVEVADVVDAVLEHHYPLGPMPKAKPLYLLRS